MAAIKLEKAHYCCLKQLVSVGTTPMARNSVELVSVGTTPMARNSLEAQAQAQAQGENTKDGSVDLKGNHILRKRQGGWTACSFIVAFETFERIASYGISSNLVIFLTDKLHQDIVSSANNVTNWVGTICLTPIFGAYIADAHLGRYKTLLVSFPIYLMGMCLLIVGVAVPSLKPTSCEQHLHCNGKASPLQLSVFYFALYILAIGTGGTRPNSSIMGADQFDDLNPKERIQKLSYFNWWMFGIYFGILFATTVLVYIQENVGWTLGYALPTMGLLIGIVIFLTGTPLYRQRPPSGSPFTKMARVLVAASIKWRSKIPADPKELHELDSEEYASNQKHRIHHTQTLRILDKAAVKTGPTSPWMLCPVTQVEEAKQMLRMIPILFATFVPSIMAAQINTLFIKQGTTLNRSIGPHFKIPSACLQAFTTVSMLLSLVIYDQWLVPSIRKWTNNPRGITMLQRLGTGIFSDIIMTIVASVTEHHRLRAVKAHGLESGGEVPITIFILLPQFVLLGVSETLIGVARTEFFYDQAPETMKSLGVSYAYTSWGIGNFLSTFLLSTVTHITKNNGHKGWILNNLNQARLDYYYAFFTILNVLNFFIFLILAQLYVYKTENTEQKDNLAVENGTQSNEDCIE